MLKKIWSRILSTLPKSKLVRFMIYAFLAFLVTFVVCYIACAESMQVNVTSSVTGNQGAMSTSTNYSSVLMNGSLLQNRYEFEAREIGGECSIDHSFGIAPSSDITATLEMEMTSGIIQPGVPVFLKSEEKVGVGLLRARGENQVEKFVGAIGSGIDAIRTVHTSESYTDNGNVGHTVLSEGQGAVIAGVVGQYYLYQGPAPEEGEGLHPQICPWTHGVELKELASQSYAYSYRYRGVYSYSLTGVIGPPPAF